MATSSSSIKQPTEYTPLKKQFTSRNNYKQVMISAEKRQIIFQDFVHFLISQNQQMIFICSKLHEQNHLLFNDCIRDSFQLVNDCWNEQFGKSCRAQIVLIQDIIHNPEYKPENTKLELMQEQAGQFEKLQDQLVSEINDQNEKMKAALVRSQKFNSERQRLMNYFNSNYLKQPHQEMNKLDEFLEQSRMDNSKFILKLEKSKLKFLSVFQNFRKICIKNRTLFEKKFYKVCGIVVEGIVKAYPQLLKQLKRTKGQLQELFEEMDGGGEDKSSSRISSDKIFSICSCIQNMMTTVVEILQNCKTQRQKFSQKLITLMKTQDNSACRTLSFVLDTLEKVDSRINQISTNMIRKIKILEEQQARLNSLGRSTHNFTLQSSIRRNKISTIESNLTVPSIMNGILDDMIDPLAKLVHWIQTSLVKQQPLYIKESQNYGKAPSQQTIYQHQMWMFEDWNSSDTIKLPICSKFKQELKRTKSTIQSQIKCQGKEIVEPQKCHLYESQNKNKKGVLYIYDNCVKFVSSEDSSVLVIPYEMITNVKNKLDMFKLNLVLYTSKGKICFVNPSKAMKSKQKILERIGKGNEGNNEAAGQIIDNTQDEKQGQQGQQDGKQKWKSVELTETEISGMEARKAKVLAEVPDKTGFKQTGTYLFKDIPIDQFYHQIYSDEPKQVNGKKWQSFNQHMVDSTGKNTNMSETKWNHKGPKFYSLTGDSTFDNCPSYSERQTKHTHALDSIPIPFMPKTADFRQVHKLYWVSNEQFVNTKQTYSSGMSLFQSFYVKFINHVRKKGNDVELVVHISMIWVKDSRFRGLLERKCMEKITDNMPKMMKSVENRVKSVVAASRGGKSRKAERLITPVEDGQSTQAETNLSSSISTQPGSQIKITEQSTATNSNFMYLIGGIIIIIILLKFLL